MAAKRVTISGGSGLIGRALVDELAASGWEVRVLSRTPRSVSGLPRGSRVDRWDGRSVAQLTPLVDGVDAVVHLAGETIAGGRWTAPRKRRIRDSRVGSSSAVAEAILAAASRPSVLVQASAVGYYGPRGDETIDEEAPAGGDFLANVTAAWEAASAAVEEAGVRRPIIRTGIVLSTDGGALPRIVLPFRLFAGGPLGSGEQWVPWIHLADEVGAIRFLIENDGAAGPFNLTAPEPLTNREFGRVVGRVLGRPSRLPTPAFALRLALGEMATLLLDGQRAVPRRLLELGYEFRFATAEAALRDLLG